MKSEDQMHLFPLERVKATKQRPRSISMVQHEIKRRLSILRRMQSRLMLRAAPVWKLVASVATRPWTEISELVTFVYWDGEGIISEEQMADALSITVDELRAKVSALKIPRQCKSCDQRCVVTVRTRDERHEALTEAVICQPCSEYQTATTSHLDRRPLRRGSDLVSMHPVGRVQ